MNKKHKRRKLVSVLLKEMGDTQIQRRIFEKINAVTYEKDRYIFSSVYPNEAIMNRVEAILRNNREKAFDNKQIVLSKE